MTIEGVRQPMRRELKCIPCSTGWDGPTKKLQRRWDSIELLLHGFVVSHEPLEVGSEKHGGAIVV